MGVVESPRIEKDGRKLRLDLMWRPLVNVQPQMQCRSQHVGDAKTSYRYGVEPV